MQKTKIEWVRSPDGSPGWTFNPITGCLNNCSYCYARKLANTRLRERYLANKNILSGYTLARGVLKEGAIPPSLDPFFPRFWEDRLQDIKEDWTTLAGRQHVKPRGIFVCDMSDLFGIGVPESWTRRVFEKIERLPQHRFYLLTKQPQNLQKFSPFPDNCWVGQTITQNLDGLHYFSEIEAKVKFISYEPLQYYSVDVLTASALFKVNGIKWVIIGAQTKPYKPPEISWVREIVQACDKAGISVFLKDNLIPLLVGQPSMPDWARRGAELRQEMPTTKV